MLKVFIGYDPRQAVSYNVCQHSILIRTLKPVAIVPLVIETLPINRQGLTPFTWSRFLVPYLSEFKGISIFLDADILLQHDINELEYEVKKLASNGVVPAVSVVKSMHKFEWSSMMVFNCEHPDNAILTPEYIENTNDSLHKISWTNSIGQLSSEWNHLVGYDKPWDQTSHNKIKLIHYTQGVPAWVETSDCEFSAVWQKELMYINSCIEWVELMGKSVHSKVLSDGSVVPKYKNINNNTIIQKNTLNEKDHNIINTYALNNNLSLIKLNLGCGGRPIKDWINIDNYDYEKNDSSRTGSKYDIKMDIRNLDCKNGTIDKILLVHVIEHFVRWETINLVRHYYQKLKIGGQLIVEMPDLHECIKIYLQENAPHMKTKIGSINIGRTQFFGNQWDELDYETHRYVWEINEFTTVLKSEGFRIIKADHDAIFHVKGRDMFVIAEKI